MAGRSVLYLGSSDYAADFCTRLRASPSCGQLSCSPTLTLPEPLPENIDLIFFEAGPAIAQSGQSLASLVQEFGRYPLLAVASRDHEHRAIAAVRAGAQGHICADDVNEVELEAIIDHATQRHRLLTRLSETDSTVLSILKSINDGVIVVDRHGHVLDINPAARSILDLAPRQQTDTDWARSFCSIRANGDGKIDHDELPLVKACRGEKFSNQVAIYRLAGQADTILSINGQGLYDSSRSLIGGVITFRDITDVMRRTVELEKRAQYDELTLLPNRRLFTQQLKKAIGRSQRSNKPLAVLFIDLDRFKSVNDTLGHDIGDELLRQVAERLSKNLRVGDFSGRWGGDEFVVCIEDFEEPRNAALARFLGHVGPTGYVLIADERSNMAAFRAVIAADSADWDAVRDTGATLFLQRRY